MSDTPQDQLVPTELGALSSTSDSEVGVVYELERHPDKVIDILEKAVNEPETKKSLVWIWIGAAVTIFLLILYGYYCKISVVGNAVHLTTIVKTQLGTAQGNTFGAHDALLKLEQLPAQFGSDILQVGMAIAVVLLVTVLYTRNDEQSQKRRHTFDVALDSVEALEKKQEVCTKLLEQKNNQEQQVVTLEKRMGELSEKIKKLDSEHEGDQKELTNLKARLKDTSKLLESEKNKLLLTQTSLSKREEDLEKMKKETDKVKREKEKACDDLDKKKLESELRRSALEDEKSRAIYLKERLSQSEKRKEEAQKAARQEAIEKAEAQAKLAGKKGIFMIIATIDNYYSIIIIRFC